MPLPSAAPRHLRHSRTIQCTGYRRDDGLWDIEAHMVDTKSFAFPNQWRGEIQADEALHDMWLRLTVDKQLTIQAVEACIDDSPFEICPKISQQFKQLQGIRIGMGWRYKINQVLGGVKGCTHLLELLTLIATVAFQTVQGDPQINQDAAPSDNVEHLIDTCHALAENGEVIKMIKAQQQKNSA